MTIVGLAVAAGLGAVVRFRLSPYGWRATLAVNVVGSLVLGVLLARSGPGSDAVTVLGAGFCGALTTFGTFALEASTGPARLRATIVATNLVACIAAATLGHAVG